MTKRINHSKLNQKKQTAKDAYEDTMGGYYDKTAQRIARTGRSAWDQLRDKWAAELKRLTHRNEYLEKELKTLKVEYDTLLSHYRALQEECGGVVL